MAKFNPDIPDVNPPSYLNMSRPIESYSGDLTSGTALKGLGDLLGNAVKGADEVIQTTIERGLYNAIDTQREAQTGALEQVAGISPANRVGDIQPTLSPAEGGPNGSPNIIPGATAPVPAVLQGIDQAVSNIQSGLTGKPALQTYYTGRLDLISKDYRAQYPGYREIIDKKVAEITGINPANEYLKELFTGIQSTLSKGQQEKETALKEIASNAGIPNATNTARAVSAGVADPISYVVGWMAPWKQIDYQLKQTQEANSAWKGSFENQILYNKQTASNVSSQISDTLWTQTINGIQKTPEEISKWANDVQTGVIKPNQDDFDNYSMALSTIATQARQQTAAKLNASGVGAIIGPDEVKKQQDASASKFEQTAQLFQNKDAGAAFAAERFIAAQTAANGQWLLRDSPQKDFFNVLSSGTKLGGPGFVGLMTQDFVGGKYGQTEDTVKQYSIFNALRMSSQPNSSLDTVLTDMSNKGVGKDPSQASQRQAYQYFTTELPGKIADTKIAPTARTQLAKNIFNGDITAKFNNDSFDEQGNQVPGKHTVLNNMTTPEIRDSIWKLSSNGTGPLWSQYKNWVSRNTSETLNTDVHDLQSTTSNPNIKFTYSTDTHTFSYVNNDPNKNSFYMGAWPLDPTRRALEGVIPQKLELINQGLKATIAIAEKEGRDPNVAVFNTMRNLGLDPRGVDMPSELMRTIIGPAPQPDKKSEVPVEIKPAHQYVQDAGRIVLPQKIQDYIANLGKNSNIGDITSIDNQDIPEGMTARDFIKFLKSKKHSL